MSLGENGPQSSGEGTRDAIRPLQALLVAAIFTPIVLFCGAGFLTYNNFFAEARERNAQLLDIASQNALNIFGTASLAVDRIADRTAGMSWGEIARSRDVYLFLRQIKTNLPQVGAVGMVGADHHVIAMDLAFPSPDLAAAPRNYIAVPRPGNEDLLISNVIMGQVTKRNQFVLARRRLGAHGENAGLIQLTVDSADLANYYDVLAANSGIHITLARADGVVLARNPEAEAPQTIGVGSKFMEMIREQPEAGEYETHSVIDGKDRLFAYQRLPGFPIYVAVGIDRATIVQGWLRLMSSHLIYGVPVTLMLIFATMIALRRTRQAAAEAERRAELEDQYRQAQKMEAIGQLTGGVAHDFNNLLTVIMGSLEQLQAQVTSEAGKRLLGMAQRGAERGEHLTQSLLSFARRQSLHPETVNLNRLIKDFSELLRRGAGDLVQIRFLLNPTVDPCRIDPAQFQSALLNLVVNSRDAMAATGGQISIETDNVSLDRSHGAEIQPGPYVRVTVGDSGSGMAPEVIERAFDPFYTTKEVGKGSGLGLSQVYGFVKQSGGHLELASQVGVGTTVKIYLPRAHQPASAAVTDEQQRELPTAAQAETVLMVEDDADLREMVAENLRDLGYRVLTAPDGPAALALLEGKEKIDLLFSDFSMPSGMLGDELARRARLLKRGIKVLLTSGYALARDSGEPGGFSTLQKPYRQEDLARAIRQALEGDR